MYSLVALGFVLIYKASGVFNFAQGSMVFFAALTFVGLLEHGFSFWLALPATLLVMVVAGACDRARRPAAAGQPAADHAVHGDHRPFIRDRRPRADRVGRGRARARPGHRGRADPVDLRQHRNERLQVRPDGRRRRGDPGQRAGGILQPHADRTRAARGGRRSPGGAGRRHSAAADLVDRVGGGRRRRAGRGTALGRAQRRAVRADVRRAEGAAGADPRRLRVDSGRDRRRPHHRRDGEARGGLSRSLRRRRHRGLVSRTCWRSCSCWSGPRGCSARRSSVASDAQRPNERIATRCSTEKQASSRRATRPIPRSFRSARIASRWRRSWRSRSSRFRCSRRRTGFRRS